MLKRGACKGDDAGVFWGACAACCAVSITVKEQVPGGQQEGVLRTCLHFEERSAPSAPSALLCCCCPSATTGSTCSYTLSWGLGAPRLRVPSVAELAYLPSLLAISGRCSALLTLLFRFNSQGEPAAGESTNCPLGFPFPRVP